MDADQIDINGWSVALNTGVIPPTGEMYVPRTMAELHSILARVNVHFLSGWDRSSRISSGRGIERYSPALDSRTKQMLGLVAIEACDTTTAGHNKYEYVSFRRRGKQFYIDLREALRQIRSRRIGLSVGP